MSFVIKPCDCKHTFQDKTYGKEKRVHIIGKSNMVCTVCGKRK